MKARYLYVFALLLALSEFVFAQSDSDYMVPRTEYGQPDFQGVWNFASSIPMQRPSRYGNQEFLTAEQIEEAKQKAAESAAAADEAAATLVLNPEAPEASNDPGGYNDFWFEAAGIGDTVRTSLIVYPENGQYPATVEGIPRQFDTLGADIPGTRPVRTLVGGIAKEGPEDRGLSERCLVGFNSGPPFTPSLYNNNVQFIQSRDTVVIFTEMIHDARIVPLGDKPELDDNIRLWSGDSRGWFEGDTLVVETKNFNGLRQSLNFSGTGTNLEAVLTERFTRISYDTAEYKFTIDDPGTYTDKLTAIVPLTKVAGQLYEYACHEGNYGMGSIMRGARLEDEMASDEGAATPR
jgi:hypothetical protein